MRWSARLVLLAAVLVHGGMLIGWRWQSAFVPYFFDATVLSGGRGLDFYSIYQAGYNARHGADIYEGDPATVEVVVPYFTPYRYLPIVAYTVGAGLSLFTPLTAYKIWVVVIELTLLLCAALTWRKVPDRNLAARLAAMWLAFTPFYLELFMGQFSLVQGALIFGILLLTTERTEHTEKTQLISTRHFAAVDWLWLTSMLWKINTFILTPVFLHRRRWRVLALAAVIIPLTTLPYFLIFPTHFRDFLLNNFGNSVTGHELGNLGFRQLVFELLAALGASPPIQRSAQTIIILLVLGLALLLTFWPRPTQAPSTTSAPKPATWNLTPDTWNLSLWLTAFFLLSPQIWEHHYVMLLPVLVVSYWQRPHWVVTLIWLVLALPTPFGFIGLQPLIASNHDLRAFPLEPAWQPLVQHASKAVPTLLLFIHLARQCWRTAVQTNE